MLHMPVMLSCVAIEHMIPLSSFAPVFPHASRPGALIRGPLCVSLVHPSPQYKFHEDIFDQLLLTPELDRKLAAGDSSTKWAAANVEGAVAKAIRIAFSGDSRASSPSNDSSSSSNSSSAMSSLDAVRRGDGMGAQVGHSQPSSGRTVAAAAMQQQQQEPAVAAAIASSAPGGCNSNSDDEQCEVDWDALFASFEEDQEVHSELTKEQTANFTARQAAAPGGSTMDFISDAAAAAGAAKVEAATKEPFDVTAAHTFLQRLLYKINRLNHFW
jgi:hypothetical protein